MSTFLTFVTVIVMLLVVFFLGRGLVNMMLGGNPRFSNKMMQARIAFQALAIILIMLTLWLAQSGH
ncbi:twin transmembrane helix small protein [Martelella endophytica]|uniref:Membrane protein n=1 Tax=Martelella endophytica TaxID=1486262 RepID=A0A0D5LMX7_MAREN|nr:twin transmembrane helix small protein [Martelella endophytica]AJY45569.1 membrane protein [Martelella endophytica]